MKSIRKMAGAIVVFFVLAVADIPQLSRMLVPEAQAFRGRGAAFVIGASVGQAEAAEADADAAEAEAEAAAAKQQAAAAEQKAAAAEQELALEKQKSAAAQQAAPLPAVAPGKPLPLGTVVPALPAGCVATPVNNVNYYYCGGNFYKAAYQGSTLVYVTTEAK